MTDLIFRDALGPQPGAAVELVFGRTGAPPPSEPEDPRPGLLRASVAAPWRRAVGLPARQANAPWRTAAHVAADCTAPWATSALRAASVRMPWATSQRLAGAIRLPWASTAAVSAHLAVPWASAVPLAGHLVAPWRAGAPIKRTTLAAWREALRSATRVLAPWRRGQRTVVALRASAQRGHAAGLAVRAPWRTGLHVESIGGPWGPTALVPPLPVPCYLPDPGDDVLLLFKGALTGLADLIFACRRAALAVVPIRRVYMITNVTTLVRVSDGSPVPCLGMTLSLDVDSWAWGFSASLPADALAMIEPSVAGGPVELAASVNGTEFRVIAEALSRERTFGKASVRVQGRGRTALLDAPYSEVSVFGNISTRTSQQLVDEALPFGWTADWGLTAWNVPGGIWTHQGTPISAALAVAAAGGAYLLPHASAASFAVLPRYPVAPWNWGSVSPDLELPAAVTTREAIEWVELPRYNRVYVSGTTSGGKRVPVTRLGSAGDVVAPMITDPLITHADAGRQRGLPVLARTGRWADVTLRLPVLSITGVIRPGQFVRYVDGTTVRLGLARSVSVEVQGAQAWQTIKVETYVG